MMIMREISVEPEVARLYFDYRRLPRYLIIPFQFPGLFQVDSIMHRSSILLLLVTPAFESWLVRVFCANIYFRGMQWPP